MKHEYYFLSLILLLCISLTACGNRNNMIADETPMYSADPGPYHGGLTENKEYIVNFFAGKKDTKFTISENQSLAVRFFATTVFDRIDVLIEANSGIIQAELYKWENNYPKKPEGEALATAEFNGADKEKYTEFKFEGIPEGDYMLVLTQKSGTSTLRKYSNKRSKVDLYFSGYFEPASMDIRLKYIHTPVNELYDLPEYVIPAITPYPEPEEKYAGYVKPDTWTAVDGLGRTLPLYSSLKEKNPDKKVGIFYWTWHGELSKSSQARNITEIISKYPDAVNDFKHKAWKGYTGYHFWNEPLYGYYSTNDEYVLRKHAEMLADAGIDFIVFDCTNGSYTWTESYMNLLKVFSEAKKDGVNVPKITFMSNFAPIESTKTFITTVYNELYLPGLYNDLWFYVDGKPLMWAFPQVIDSGTTQGEDILNFFTFRYPYAEGISEFDKKNSWGWAGSYPNDGYGESDGKYEQMSISIAVNANGPMNNPNAWGRAFSHSGYKSSYTYGGRTVTVSSSMENAKLYGIFIQEQWDYCIEKDPEIMFVCGWNEWVAMRHESWGGYENAFPDEFNDEYSRDIEPSKGDLKDHYYYQLVSNVRKFKGVSVPEMYSVRNTINIFGDIKQWDDVDCVFYHYKGNTMKRDHAGYQGTYYESDTMRNDIHTAKVAYDKENIYFYVKTVNNITPYTDPNWMRLYIDTDFTGNSPNWEGFEYVINRNNPTSDKCTVEKSKGGYEWLVVGEVSYTIKQDVLQISVPRNMISQNDNLPSFSFKWADNNCPDGDIMSFYTDGDAAPGGRFCFAFNVGNRNNNYLLKTVYALSLFASIVTVVIRKIINKKNKLKAV